MSFTGNIHTQQLHYIFSHNRSPHRGLDAVASVVVGPGMILVQDRSQNHDSLGPKSGGRLLSVRESFVLSDCPVHNPDVHAPTWNIVGSVVTTVKILMQPSKNLSASGSLFMLRSQKKVPSSPTVWAAAASDPSVKILAVTLAGVILSIRQVLVSSVGRHRIK